ncbi:hypothetical protein [Poriferisphaera sp. WC338]|uniref:hypothetical protein n=1 Tax=Poriferisphaera sp. WC338 TaxID=3425129 RepID=UPI003D814153
MIHTASSMMSTLNVIYTFGQTRQHQVDIWYYMGAIVLLAIFLGLAAFVIRKLTLRDDGPAMEGYSLSDLRQMHKEGKISDEEFQNMKMLIITSSRKVLEDDAEKKDDWENISESDKSVEGEFGAEELDEEGDEDEQSDANEEN